MRRRGLDQLDLRAQKIVCPPGTPQANALLTVMHKLAVDVDRVGDSTGEIDV